MVISLTRGAYARGGACEAQAYYQLFRLLEYGWTQLVQPYRIAAESLRHRLLDRRKNVIPGHCQNDGDEASNDKRTHGRVSRSSGADGGDSRPSPRRPWQGGMTIKTLEAEK